MELLKLSAQTLLSCTQWFCCGDDHAIRKGYTEQPTLPHNCQRTLWFSFNFLYTFFWSSWNYCSWGCLCASPTAWDTPGNTYSIKNVLDWVTRRTQVSLTACTGSFTSRLVAKVHDDPAESQPCPASALELAVLRQECSKRIKLSVSGLLFWDAPRSLLLLTRGMHASADYMGVKPGHSNCSGIFFTPAEQNLNLATMYMRYEELRSWKRCIFTL